MGTEPKLEQIVEKNNTLESLKALRRKLANALDNTKSGRDIASLSRQLQIVMMQIAEIENKYGLNDETELDEIINRKRTNKVRPDKR